MTDTEFNTVPVLVLDGGGTTQNPACDICGEPGGGTLVAAADVRHAVIVKRFNPYASVPKLVARSRDMSPLEGQRLLCWLLGNDSSDWNVCGSCLKAMAEYLPPVLTPVGRSMSVTLTGLPAAAC
ncbi:MAG: hypothetical protein WCK89_14840 [bacterium]